MSSSRLMPRVVLVLFSLWPHGVSGQALWTEASTIGYGALGLGAGIPVCGLLIDTGSFDDDFLFCLGGALIGGMVLGHRIGGSAEGAANRGEVLSSGQLWGARVGTVTGFAALGALTAAIIISSTEGNSPGEDERRLRNYTVAGAGLGILTEILYESGLSQPGESSPVRLRVKPHIAGGIRIGLVINSP